MEKRKSLTRLTVCTLTSIDITDQREDKEPLPSTTQEDAKGEGEGKDPEGSAVSSEAGIDKDGVNYSSNTEHQVWVKIAFFLCLFMVEIFDLLGGQIMTHKYNSRN